MPELPEVETILRTLQASGLVGRMITRVRVCWPREVAHPSADEFVRRLQGNRFVGIARHGKYALLHLSDGTLVVHLRMSGRLELVPLEHCCGPHVRLVWELDDGRALRFEDARKFGRAWWLKDPRTLLDKLGPDALVVEAETFAHRLAARRGALKALLLDQSFVAGVGNIYADEALFRAGLHPRRLAQTLQQHQRQALYRALRETLLDGIAANGASFDWVYPGGHFQNHFQVYGRAGLACVRCATPIVRIRVAQRSTYFCPQCQQ